MANKQTITNKSASTNVDNALSMLRLQRNEHLRLMLDLNFLIEKADRADVLQIEIETLKKEVENLNEKNQSKGFR